VNLVNSIAAATPNELDLVGVLTSDGVSAFSGGSNLADYTQNSSIPAPVIGATLAGTFAADAGNPGRYTGSLSVTSLAGSYAYLTGVATPVPTPGVFNVAIYQATTSRAFVVETDKQAIATGQMVQQNLP
jgi:hypothetical protein